jgi:hypothetical protein
MDWRFLNELETYEKCTKTLPGFLRAFQFKGFK